MNHPRSGRCCTRWTAVVSTAAPESASPDFGPCTSFLLRLVLALTGWHQGTVQAPLVPIATGHWSSVTGQPTRRRAPAEGIRGCVGTKIAGRSRSGKAPALGARGPSTISLASPGGESAGPMRRPDVGCLGGLFADHARVLFACAMLVEMSALTAPRIEAVPPAAARMQRGPAHLLVHPPWSHIPTSLLRSRRQQSSRANRHSAYTPHTPSSL